MFLTNSYAAFSLFHVSYIYCAQYRTPNMKIEKLIERVKAGDTDALKTVYQAYYNPQNEMLDNRKTKRI